ncbi:MAG: FtsX-like permease family protein [Patescibacteria group bacterium]
MRVSDTLSLSTRMFHTRMLRTALTILGMSVGIGTIVFLFSLGTGLQVLLIESIAQSEALLSLDVYPADAELLKLDTKALEKFNTISSVTKVVPVSILAAQLTDSEGTTDVSAQIAEPAIFPMNGFSEDKIAPGKLYDVGDDSGVLVASSLAETFAWTPEEILGKQVTLTIFIEETVEYTATSTTVVATNELVKNAVIIGIIPSESPTVYFSPGLIPEITMKEYTQAKVGVENADVLDGIRNTILEMGFSVQALSDVVDQANKVFRAVQIILVVFGAAALVVSAIGMINTMTIAFLERTQEIGIMRSLGASRVDMFWLFLIESGLMGFLGGVGGVLIGLLGQVIVTTGLDFLASQLGGTQVDIFKTPIWFVAIIIIFSTMVGFVTGILPGRRAFHLNPLTALKYK